MYKESIVQIKGHRYKYRYDSNSGKTIYVGPVGDAPALTEEEFEDAILQVEFFRDAVRPTRLRANKQLKQLKDWQDKGLETPPSPGNLKFFQSFDGVLKDVVRENLGNYDTFEWDEWNNAFRFEFRHIYRGADANNPDLRTEGEMTQTYWIDPREDIEEQIKDIAFTRDKIRVGELDINL